LLFPFYRKELFAVKVQKNKESAKRFGILFPKKVSKIAFLILVQKLQVYKLKIVISKFVHFLGDERSES